MRFIPSGTALLGEVETIDSGLSQVYGRDPQVSPQSWLQCEDSMMDLVNFYGPYLPTVADS